MSRVHKQSDKWSFDKYSLYQKSVQSPDTDVVFLKGVYRELRGQEPQVFREDFCGTFALSCEWVKLGPQKRAYGVDLDPEPLAYGRENNWTRLSAHQRKRLEVYEKNVLEQGLPKSDITVAMNFSYFLFKKRSDLRKYFQSARAHLKNKGLFVIDLFGGSLCYDENEEKTKHRGFTYFWEQEGFDPVSNEAKFHIHFKLDGQKKSERVFSYDWRMWSIPELREILSEAGFRHTHVYWEGTTKKGAGDGVFKRVQVGEACQSWIAYIVSEP